MWSEVSILCLFSTDDNELKVELKSDMKNGSGDGLAVEITKPETNGDINDANLEINNVKPVQKSVKLEPLTYEDKLTKTTQENLETK